MARIIMKDTMLGEYTIIHFGKTESIPVVLAFGIQRWAKSKSVSFYLSFHLDTSNMICSLLVHLIGNYISSWYHY